MIAQFAPAPEAKNDRWPAIHASAAPSGYGGGMFSVVSATAKAPARSPTSGASAGVNGRGSSRPVSSVGISMVPSQCDPIASHAWRIDRDLDHVFQLPAIGLDHLARSKVCLVACQQDSR